MSKPIPLQCEQYYHIYNRGNNRETLFRQERNYDYFLDLYTRHIYGIADTYAYCLLPNHFHLLVRIKPEEEIVKTLRVMKNRVKGQEKFTVKTRRVSQRFGNLFNAYTKAVNKEYGRTGSLFEHPFRRKLVSDEKYLRQLIMYIHYNPVKHGIVDDFRLWPFSSYGDMLSNQPTRLKRDDVLAVFGDIKTFKEQHAEYKTVEFDEDF